MLSSARDQPFSEPGLTAARHNDSSMASAVSSGDVRNIAGRFEPAFDLERSDPARIRSGRTAMLARSCGLNRCGRQRNRLFVEINS
jgi:hypothetical protein